MPGKVSEVRWERAKRAVRKQYPDLNQNSDRFWSLVQHVYGRMVEKSLAQYKLLKADPDKKKEPSDPRQWEPPGGSHPKTWRAQVGDSYIYRPSKPGEKEKYETTAQLFTGEQLTQMRAKQRHMTAEQHKKEAEKAKSPLMREYHNLQAMKKRDLATLMGQKKDKKGGEQKPEAAPQRAERKSERSRPTPTADKIRTSRRREGS